MNKINNLKISYIPISQLKPSTYNPRKWSEKATADLKRSIKKFGLVDPIICNSAPNRKNVLIGGHFRLKVAKDFGYKKIPVLYVNISDIEKEKELNIRLNKNVGEFDFKLLADFDENFLSDIGFTSEDLDDIFEIEENPEEFDLWKELEKLNIKKIEIRKGNVLQLGDHLLMCGDSTIKKDILKLMNGEKADMCFTDPPRLN